MTRYTANYTNYRSDYVESRQKSGSLLSEQLSESKVGENAKPLKQSQNFKKFGSYRPDEIAMIIHEII